MGPRMRRAGHAHRMGSEPAEQVCQAWMTFKGFGESARNPKRENGGGARAARGRAAARLARRGRKRSGGGGRPRRRCGEASRSPPLRRGARRVCGGLVWGRAERRREKRGSEREEEGEGENLRRRTLPSAAASGVHELHQLAGVGDVGLERLLDARQALLSAGLDLALLGQGEGDVVVELVLGLHHEALQALRARGGLVVHEVVDGVGGHAQLRDAERVDDAGDISLRVLLQSLEGALSLGLERHDLLDRILGVLSVLVADDHDVLLGDLEGALLLAQARELGRERRLRGHGAEDAREQQRAPRSADLGLGRHEELRERNPSADDEEQQGEGGAGARHPDRGAGGTG
mmetsp:Transcript_3239/g.8786  ORF Transcript_3239/g.8786 Transcript_3239/m.8786 type:complete len:347 (+) Transcript_3239:48-1088(+)